MKRQIKFRALELDTGNWVYGGFVSIDGYAMSNGVPDLNEPVTRYYISQDGERREVAEETVGQFTGLLDHSDFEVCEHDLMEDPEGRVFQVIYADGGFTLANYSDEYIYWGDLKVIGNIHNNPKLLEKGNE
ncbi:hypothetical protein NK499_002933 [Vibrio cholerae]|nr:hypothetical protein [Vibrio cholerae]